MRGTAADHAAQRTSDRFIPAHAGNGPTVRATPSTCTVHPRACGERTLCSVAVGLSSGSSPRMRGTGAKRAFRIVECAVHPRACGERGLLDRRCTGAGGSSRACGERSNVGRAASPENGSSPRMRGTGGVIRLAELILRFIPAHAGNGSTGHGSSSTLPVHPRACGERNKNQTQKRPRPGSSPRMRGTDHESRCGRNRIRFIPAHAGNGSR